MIPFLRTRSPLFWLVLPAVVVLFGALAAPGPLVTLWWMESLGYEAVFWKVVGTKTLLFAVAFVASAGFLWVNFAVMQRHFPVLQWLNAGRGRRGPGQPVQIQLTPRLIRIAGAGIAVFIGLLFGLRFVGAWELFLRFAGAAPAGVADPVFGRDVAFYLLRLPFLESIQTALAVLAFLAVVAVGAGYAVLGNVGVERGRLRAPRPVLLHLAVLVALLLAAWGWGFYLDRFALLTARSGVVFGARYIDLHFVVPTLWALVAGSGVLAALALYSAFAGRFRLLAVSAGLYAAVLVLGLYVVPAAVQSVRVEPNELQLETPYLQHNIEMTRRAFGLDRIREETFPAADDLTLDELEGYRETLENIRLWDPRLIVQTFRQLQEIRLYYQFYDVDVDRYWLDSTYMQVLLSARELEQALPERANTWVNRHLQYTHGYGLTMALAAQSGLDGSPRLVVRDVPPVAEGGLAVTRPAIYFGEQNPTYRIVNTRVEEMDYPSGDDNAYTRYEGTGGVRLGSAWRRLLYAWHMGDASIFLSDYVTPASRIQYWARLQERIARIAPFLQLDADPYLVLSEGRLFWIQDAYTAARTYPYSEPTASGVNYVRNAAKVVVDAYEGTVTFYAADATDPILAAYRAAFPGLFHDLDAMPEGLRAHLRYPEDLFRLQIEKYNRYHMTAPQVFYNNEDLWAVPREQYGGEMVQMEPYYVLTSLPGSSTLEFLLMQPMTPQNRDNMIAWMAARCDPANYGELVVYKLPKDRLIYGPNQMESRIDQDPLISQQLALWDQRGSRVIRGNLLVIPVASSFLYVEPVFLIAQGTQIPELQRVIVGYDERVAMATSLDGALAALFGAPEAAPRRRPAAPAPAASSPVASPPAATDATLDAARAALDRATEALRAGDFAAFGREFETLQRILHETKPPDPE